MYRSLKINPETSLNKFIEQKVNTASIPERWKKYLHGKIVESVNDTTDFDDLRAVLRSWNWVNSKSDIYWIIINTLDYTGAASASNLKDFIIQDYEDDFVDPKREKSLINIIRKSLKRMYKNNVIDTIKMDSDELGHTQYSVTIWLSPFVKEKQLTSTKNLYIKSGGVNYRRKVKKPKTPEYVVSHNDKVKKLSKPIVDEKPVVKMCPVCKKVYPVDHPAVKCPDMCQVGGIRTTTAVLEMVKS